MPNQNIAEAGKATRFQKGQAKAGPGRPKTKPISDAFREILEELEPRTRKTLARKIAEVAVKRAEQGSISHLREITDRVEGKVPQSIANEGDGPVVIVINPAIGGEY